MPEGSRASQGKSLRSEFLSDENIERIRALNRIAEKRGQTLAQMAIAWVLRGGRVTTALIGASRPEQVEDCVGALAAPEFTAQELTEIDQHAREADINLWAASAERKGPVRKVLMAVITNPILPGFNPDPSIVRVGTELLHRHLDLRVVSGRSRSTIRRIS